VIGTNPPDGQIIKQGQTVTLTCSTNVNWFFCVWRSPGGGKQCAIQETTTQVIWRLKSRNSRNNNKAILSIEIEQFKKQQYSNFVN
jgi:hypothetical protein